MIVVFPCYLGDLPQLVELLKWIELLGGCKGHKALICVDASVGWHKALEAKTEADKSFDSTNIICTSKACHSWPKGANCLFARASEDIAKFRKEPWLWMEPDAIPLKPGWMNEIQLAYDQSKAPYMGHVYECSNVGMPARLMSGIAVYQPQAFQDLKLNPNSLQAFDVDSAGKLVSYGANTELIHHFWGEKDKPPIFAETAISNTEVFDLSRIPEKAVIFHRNKDGSLIRLLKKRMGIPVVDPQQKPKVFIQGGRFGDLIIISAACWYHYRKTGVKPIVISSNEFSSVLEGCSYIRSVPLHYHWWSGMPQLRGYAQQHYGGGEVTQCYAHEWGIDLNKWPCFMESMLDRAGLPISEIPTAPLNFDNRNPAREQRLIQQFRRTKKPLLIVNFSGNSSPFPHTGAVTSFISKYHQRFEILDIGKIRAMRLYDLLGLMELAKGMILTDSSTYHLAHATKTPYIAFLNGGWTGSTFRSSVTLGMRYGEVLSRMGELDSILEGWLK